MSEMSDVALVGKAIYHERLQSLQTQLLGLLTLKKNLTQRLKESSLNTSTDTNCASDSSEQNSHPQLQRQFLYQDLAKVFTPVFMLIVLISMHLFDEVIAVV